jgi:hypothetical protein
MMDIAEKFDYQRRRDGLLLGMLTGLIFGLTSQGLNYLAVGGISFYQPPFGPIGNTLLWIFIGGSLGIVTVWAGGSLFGVMMGGLLAGVMIFVSALLGSNLNRNVSQKVVGLIGFYLPFAAMTVPLLGLLRAAVNVQREWYELPVWGWRRAALPLLLLLVAGGMGCLWLYPWDGRLDLANMDQMIRSGLSSGNPAALPRPFQDPLVGPFLEKATANYTLELDREDLNRYQIPFVPMGDLMPSVVVARFSSGWALACLYINPAEAPFCRSFDDLANQVQ